MIKVLFLLLIYIILGIIFVVYNGEEDNFYNEGTVNIFFFITCILIWPFLLLFLYFWYFINFCDENIQNIFGKFIHKLFIIKKKVTDYMKISSQGDKYKKGSG